MTQDRRKFLAFAAMTPLAAFGASRAFAADTTCFDLTKLPASQQGFRKSMQFQVTSSDPAKKCELCAFYKPTAGDCGTCQIFSGPVFATSVCASFAAKAH